MHILEKLDAITKKNKSLVCVGLDTVAARLPSPVLSSDNPVLAFNRRIIEATADIVQAYKLNLAFYEALGRFGYDTLRGTLKAIPGNVVVIGDGKRGDIGNTSVMYARALFEDLGFDAATVSPYMGFDSVKPFIDFSEKGVFVLALTSNPGSRDFQYLETGGTPLYRRVVEAVVRWNTDGNCGLVVGATHPDELAEVRAAVGDMPILVPGLGVQGGNVERTVEAAVTPSGMRAVFNASRAVLYAGSGSDFAECARRAVEELRDAVNTRIRPG
ncbi:MAG: orotidine-5'-phosphate decarboxylase [Bacteroidota bacterium]|nr:orotidine-5'-phosphate decarboxylase [Bacteroidota bacterium]